MRMHAPFTHHGDAPVPERVLRELGQLPYPDSLCGEPTCYHGGVIINGRDYRCAECVRLGYVDAATGQVLLMEGERP